MVSGQASVNRSMTLENLPAMAGVNVSSYLHRERTGIFGTAIPTKAAEFAGNLIAAANTREVTDSARAHALAQLEGASGDKPTVTEDYLHMAAYQVILKSEKMTLLNKIRPLFWGNRCTVHDPWDTLGNYIFLGKCSIFGPIWESQILHNFIFCIILQPYQLLRPFNFFNIFYLFYKCKIIIDKKFVICDSKKGGTLWENKKKTRKSGTFWGHAL